MLSLPQGILASFIGMLVEVQLRHLLRLVHCLRVKSGATF